MIFLPLCAGTRTIDYIDVNYIRHPRTHIYACTYSNSSTIALIQYATHSDRSFYCTPASNNVDHTVNSAGRFVDRSVQDVRMYPSGCTSRSLLLRYHATVFKESTIFTNRLVAGTAIYTSFAVIRYTLQFL